MTHWRNLRFLLEIMGRVGARSGRRPPLEWEGVREEGLIPFQK